MFSTKTEHRFAVSIPSVDYRIYGNRWLTSVGMIKVVFVPVSLQGMAVLAKHLALSKLLFDPLQAPRRFKCPCVLLVSFGSRVDMVEVVLTRLQ